MSNPATPKFRLPGVIGWIATLTALATMIGLPLALDDSVQHRLPLVIVIEFVCLVLLLMFWGGSLKGIATRILGATIFVLYVIYLISEIRAGPATSSSPAVPSVRNALLGLFIYGGAGLYLAIRGPAAFRRKQPPNPTGGDTGPVEHSK